MTAGRTGPAPTVVVGYDGSAEALAAVDHAAGRAGPGGLVVIVRSPGRWPDPSGARHETAREALEDVLLLGGERLLETEWETEVADGPPAEAILRVARERDADEIVVGSRGRGAARALLGSVSGGVVRDADRPVTVIPTGAVR